MVKFLTVQRSSHSQHEWGRRAALALSCLVLPTAWCPATGCLPAACSLPAAYSLKASEVGLSCKLLLFCFGACESLLCLAGGLGPPDSLSGSSLTVTFLCHPGVGQCYTYCCLPWFLRTSKCCVFCLEIYKPTLGFLHGPDLDWAWGREGQGNSPLVWATRVDLSQFHSSFSLILSLAYLYID